MKHEKYIIRNDNKELSVDRWKGIMYVPIPLVKSVGMLYHKLNKGQKIRLLFRRDPTENTIELLFLLSTSDAGIDQLNKTLEYFLAFAREEGVREVTAIVVNKRLNNRILERYGWKFTKKNWYVGDHYKLNL